MEKKQRKIVSENVISHQLFKNFRCLLIPIELKSDDDEEIFDARAPLDFLESSL